MPETRTAGLRVLLVEDEMMIAMAMEDMLAELGHRVGGPVARLAKAMEAARREAFDVAILDVNLNGQDVYPVAEALAGRGIPFVFTTGYTKSRLRPPYGDRPTLQKPFRMQDLRTALAAVNRRD
ncbi:MAG TPA: response regulator [Alphaproteobacteria bacterium]|nr:response regulator [Alphaproteobacteria bacterium]